MSLYLCLLRDTPPRKTQPRRSEWGSSLPPDCFVPRESISTHEYYLTWVFTGRDVSTSPNPQAGGPPLVGSPRLLILFIHRIPLYRRPFLRPQHEDAPCHGDRDPLNTVCLESYKEKYRKVHLYIKFWRVKLCLMLCGGCTQTLHRILEYCSCNCWWFQ
jgi:hypothetical protein